MTAIKLKKGDKVVVLTGSDKGKEGEILKVLVKENRVVVQGVNLAKKHKKPSMTNAGGISEMEAPIHVSNVAAIDPKSGKPTRVGFKTKEDGTKIRIARKSGEALDA